MDKQNHYLVLTSGGADSLAVVEHMRNVYEIPEENIQRVWFNYDAKRQCNEHRALLNCSKGIHKNLPAVLEIGIDPMIFWNNNGKGYYPARNFIFLSTAVSLAETYKIENGKQCNVITGILPYGEYADTEVVSLDDFTFAMDKTGVGIWHPWITINAYKEDILENLRDAGFLHRKDFWSCTGFTTYSNIPCGSCPNCTMIKEVYGEDKLFV